VLLLCVAAALLFSSSNAFAAGSIVNGSFETDPFSFDGTLDLGGASTLTGWTTLNNGTYPWGLPNTNTYNAGPTPYGNQWVIVGNFCGGGTWIEQTVGGFTVGETSTLSFALASEQPSQTGALVEVSFPSGSSTASQTFEAPLRGANYWDTWGTFSMQFVANSTSVTIRFAGLAGPGCDAGIDNVNVSATTVAAPTSTTYTGGTSVQYSDSVALSGTLLDTSGVPTGIAGKQLDFTLGTQNASASPTDASGNASTSLVVTQKPGSVSTVATAFAGDATYSASSDSDPFTIAKEDCTLTYSGDTLVPPATMTNLAADMGEPDASLGDRSNKTVTFTVVDAALNTQTFTATTDGSGHASTSVALADGVYGVSVSFAGDDFYLPCATAAYTLVTVEAAAAKVTGGGWIAIGTGRTSFGFNAIPIAGGGFRGQFQLRSNNGKSRFHGNVVSSLSGSGNTATWSGTGSWNGQAGYTYTISVVDNGSSGSKKGDTISITITSPASVVVYSTGGPQALKGGNITVH
jgi:hypothetical protein